MKQKEFPAMIKQPMTLFPPPEKRTRTSERVIEYKAAWRRPKKSNICWQVPKGRVPKSSPGLTSGSRSSPLPPLGEEMKHLIFIIF
jgi:hypothetical protein